MRELAKKLLRTIRKHDLLRAGNRVAVAVSGGADSVALLCLLEELRGEVGIVLSVAHVNHKLRGAESDGDERFVADLSAAHGLEFHRVVAPVKETLIKCGAGAPTRETPPLTSSLRANEFTQSTFKRTPASAGIPRAMSGVEAAARELRYTFFRELARQGSVTTIATAHTLDDQAETILLRLFRGTGIRGLAGVHPRIVLKEQGDALGEVVRPLLGFRRAELRDYLQACGQEWREDSSNADVSLLRNRLRHHLLPLIAEEFGDTAIEHLAEIAEIARAEEEQWSSNALSVQASPARQSVTLDVEQLLNLPLAGARRLVRDWIETNARDVTVSFRLIEEILQLARGAQGKKLQLPGAAAGRHTNGSNVAVDQVRPRSVRRGRKELVLEFAARCDASGYEYTLEVPGEIAVPELNSRVEARLVDVESIGDQPSEGLLDREHIGSKVVIRNWRAGDRYWPAHSAAEKKVKELLSDRHATGAQKKLWPVAVNEDGRLVWLRGFPAPHAMQSLKGMAIWIREIAISTL